jgi:Protein of unknown function (DUF4019)
MIRTSFLPAILAGLSLLSVALDTSGQTSSARPGGSASGSEAEKEQVRESAEQWLAVIDGGNSAQSYRALSSVATGKVDETKWQAALAKSRAEFGAPAGREFRKATLFKAEGSTGGLDSYLVEYDSVSAERGALHEIVRMVKDGDGAWRAAGYTVGPKHQGGDDEDED